MEERGGEKGEAKMGEKARGGEERAKGGRKGGKEEKKKEGRGGSERESVYMCVMQEGDAYRVHRSKKCKNRKDLTRT